MKKTDLLIAFLMVLSISLNAQEGKTPKPKFEIKVITSVESIVPSGLGRSRIISANAERDYKDFTSSQTEDDNSSNKSKRRDIRVKDFEETKLLNFYNMFFTVTKNLSYLKNYGFKDNVSTQKMIFY